jgi:hypothetical protein
MGRGQGAVSGRAWPGIVLSDKPEPRITKAMDLRGAIVRRAVVDDDDLEIGEALRQRCSYSLLNIMRFVV